MLALVRANFHCLTTGGNLIFPLVCVCGRFCMDGSISSAFWP